MAKKAGMRGGNKADREFVSEAEEILETMRARLADLSDRLGAGAEADPEIVNALFRAAHSLKALAGMFRFDPISDLAHRLEDVLDGMRLGRVPLSSALLGWIDDVVALFASLLGQVGDGTALAESAARIAELSAGVAAVTAPALPADDLASLALDANVLRALTEYEEHRLRENLRRGRLIALVDAPFEIKSFEEGLAELSGALRENGEVLSTLPSPGDAGESQIRFSLLVASDLAEAELAARIEFPGATMRTVRAGRARPIASSAAALRDCARGRRDPGSRSRSARGDPGARVAQVDQRHGARRHPQARRPDESGRRARDRARRDRRSDRAALRAQRDRAHRRRVRQGAQGPRPQAPRAPVGGARSAHGSAAPGVREGVARGAAAAPRARQAGGARDPRRRHRARQADRRGARRSADARGAQRARPRDRARRRAARAAQGRDRPDLGRGVPARQPRGDRGARRRARDRPRRAAPTRRAGRLRAARRGALGQGDARPDLRARHLDARRGHRDERARRRHGHRALEPGRARRRGRRRIDARARHRDLDDAADHARDHPVADRGRARPALRDSAQLRARDAGGRSRRRSRPPRAARCSTCAARRSCCAGSTRSSGSRTARARRARA